MARTRSTVMAASGLGLLICAIWAAVDPVRPAPSTSPQAVIRATTTATAQPIVLRSWHIDTHGVPGATARLMVNEGAYLIVQRALDEKDRRTLAWAWETYEYMDVSPGTRVRVLKTDGERYHVEVLEGPYAGRRGWVADAYISS